MTNINIDPEQGYVYRHSATRLEVVHPIDLVGKNGYYNNHNEDARGRCRIFSSAKESGAVDKR